MNIIRSEISIANARLAVFMLVLAISMAGNAGAQSIDLYFGGGTASFLGDLGGKPTLGTNDPQDLDLETTRFGITAGARINFGKYIALRTDIWYARLAGDDKYTSNLQRRDRNLSFFTNIWEGDVLAELNLFRVNQGRGIIYFFGGVGYFYFNPKTKMNGQTYELQKYGTEGQYGMPGKSPYALSSICFPNGLGYKWAVGKGQYFALELNMRKTRTDYIDDVSTRFADPNVLIASKGQVSADLADRSNGDVPFLSSPGSIRGHDWNNDSYFFINLTYNITLGVDRGISEFKVKKPRKGGINNKKKCFEF